MSRYDFYVAGRWRDHAKIRSIVDAIRNADKTVYCFIDNEYDGDGITQTKEPLPSETTQNMVERISDWQTNPTFRKMFENDMQGLRDAEQYIIVLPAGLSAHMELGAAYGMGKPCYAIGTPEKVETLYLMLTALYPDIDAFIRDKIGAGI